MMARLQRLYTCFTAFSRMVGGSGKKQLIKVGGFIVLIFSCYYTNSPFVKGYLVREGSPREV